MAPSRLGLPAIFLSCMLASMRAGAEEAPLPPQPNGTAPIGSVPPSEPTAPREPAFGDPGEYVISGLMSASLGHLGYSASNASTTSATLQPALDYFFQPDVSLGGSAFLSYASNDTAIGIGSKTVSYGVYGRLGFNVSAGAQGTPPPFLSPPVCPLHS